MDDNSNIPQNLLNLTSRPRLSSLDGTNDNNNLKQFPRHCWTRVCPTEWDDIFALNVVTNREAMLEQRDR
jgi:hypothetical protein